MSTRTVTDCDGCGATDVGDDARFDVHLGRHMDAAGSMDDVTQPLDLCHACCVTAIREMLSAAAHGKAVEGGEFVRMVRHWKQR